MFRRLYAWTLRLAAHPRAGLALFGVSFAESSFFPIPPDAMLVPMVLARRDRAFRYAAICTIGSVLGGLAGYAIGALLLESVGKPILAFYGAMHAFEDLAVLYQEWGLWLILIKGLTPIPYKVVTIASGAFHFDLLVFVLASILTRGVRFYAEAALFWYYGEPIRRFIERYLTPLAWAFLILVIGGFAALKFLF